MRTSGTISRQLPAAAVRSRQLERHAARAAAGPRRPRPASARVDERERRVADRDAARAGDRLGRPHHAVDDPRLAPDLGRDPAGDQRDDRQRPGQRPPRGRTTATRGSRRRRTRTTRWSTPSSASSVPIPTIVWNANRTTFTGGRSVGRHGVEALHLAFGSWKASSDSSRGIAIPYSTSPSSVPAEHVDRARRASSCAEPLERGELDRLRRSRPRARPSRRRRPAPARRAPRP